MRYTVLLFGSPCRRQTDLLAGETLRRLISADDHRDVNGDQHDIERVSLCGRLVAVAGDDVLHPHSGLSSFNELDGRWRVEQR